MFWGKWFIQLYSELPSLAQNLEGVLGATPSTWKFVLFNFSFILFYFKLLQAQHATSSLKFGVKRKGL
jgi:hypothetical protein